MSNRLPLKTEDEKAFAATFRKLTGRHSSWNVWCDFVVLFACSISCAIDLAEERWKPRTEQYNNTLEKYTDAERDIIAELCAQTVAALEKNPAQDFLGSLYMALDFGNSWTGQFFTSFNVGYMMASMTDAGREVQSGEKPYVSVNDCCCGAGCMLIATAHAYRTERKGNYQTDMLFVGQDIDYTVGLMAYIQLSLLGCAGYIVIGNSLTEPLTGCDLLPDAKHRTNIWFTPMFFSPTWTKRRFAAYEALAVVPIGSPDSE